MRSAINKLRKFTICAQQLNTLIRYEKVHFVYFSMENAVLSKGKKCFNKNGLYYTLLNQDLTVLKQY